MIIEYRIKRFDLVKTFFFNLFHSRRTQIFTFGIAALIFSSSLFLQYRNNENLALNDFFVAFLWGLVFILVIPAYNFLTAKTQKRTMSISQEYIETKIGSQQGRISWKAVDSIIATDDRIYIIGKNTNSFTIPFHAFADANLRNKFIELATQYHGKLKN